MQIAEASGLAEWINKEITEAHVIQQYEALYKVINHNATRPQNEPMQPYEEQRATLFETISLVHLNALSLTQQEALGTLGIKAHIGKAGVAALQELLKNNDIAFVAQSINEIKNEIANGITKAEAMQQALEPLIESEGLVIDHDSVLTRVIFDHEASVDDIESLKYWSSKLFDIGRGFAMAQGQSPKDIRVVGASTGSFIIELAILAVKVVPVATAIGLILDAMVKYREYQIKSIEARRMKDENTDIADELEEDANRWEDRAERLKVSVVEKVTDEVRQSIDDFREENQAEFEKAIRALVDLHAKGGTVDCVIPAEREEEEGEERADDVAATLDTLRQKFARIRDLRETPLLEHSLADDEEDTRKVEDEDKD